MPNSTAELVNTFTEEVESQFSFLVSEYGFENESGLSDFKGPVSQLKTFNPGKMPGLYWLIERYNRPGIRVEIGYGDRELLIEAAWWFQDQQHGFGMWEILNAADLNSKGIGGGAWVNSSEFMKRTISDMAISLKKNIELFVNPRKELIDRALEIRGQRLRYDQDKQRELDLSHARVEAASGFRKKNYRKVIELLSPFSEILSEADHKKIKLCRKYEKII
ncbi:MAG: hypothetical protein ABW168_28105 [Sedimenticola sp.]